jgi:hypothetical protein
MSNMKVFYKPTTKEAKINRDRMLKHVQALVTFIADAISDALGQYLSSGDLAGYVEKYDRFDGSDYGTPDGYLVTCEGGGQCVIFDAINYSINWQGLENVESASVGNESDIPTAWERVMTVVYGGPVDPFVHLGDYNEVVGPAISESLGAETGPAMEINQYDEEVPPSKPISVPSDLSRTSAKELYEAAKTIVNYFEKK